jgi:chromosome segregation protein
VFDNSDSKISGPYADYAEVALRRQVMRDGTSNYFLNGARCRRKDITQLFLGTGLGSRFYAIIEQGMISRVIEARPATCAFVQEAAGIPSTRKTEARIADTRENLERLQDVRDEVDKQSAICSARRPPPAATGRQGNRTPAHAELLALRLREIDSGAEVGQRGA